ncbi:ROK family protein [Nonomuraea sp. SMC257]|uniref:ROK family protein n=1 Tax=Nonomuraea montanisoli TaxID=2741721 RepID=A0A7Y6ICD0_9ACTN|nr:ROK family protein [Nonomuraea montanisoli]
MAEHWQGATDDARDVVYMLAGHQVSVGILIDGRVREGRHGAAGEIGVLKAARWYVAPDALAARTPLDDPEFVDALVTRRPLPLPPPPPGLPPRGTPSRSAPSGSPWTTWRTDCSHFHEAGHLRWSLRAGPAKSIVPAGATARSSGTRRRKGSVGERARRSAPARPSVLVADRYPGRRCRGGRSGRPPRCGLRISP